MQGSKEGKNAWKLRKQALDDVESAVNKSNGLISTEALKPLVELLRVLRERLSDSQSNLKPVAARIIGSILGSVDTASQAKLGKIVFAPLVSAVANDNRKPMREASLEAIRVGTTASSVEGGEPNSASLESLMVAVVGELNESEFKVRFASYVTCYKLIDSFPLCTLNYCLSIYRPVDCQMCSCSSMESQNFSQT